MEMKKLTIRKLKCSQFHYLADGISGKSSKTEIIRAGGHSFTVHAGDSPSNSISTTSAARSCPVRLLGKPNFPFISW